MVLNANDIQLLEKATKYKLNKGVKTRIIKLLNNSSDEDKLSLAMDYAHSVTKCEVRGTR